MRIVQLAVFMRMENDLQKPILQALLVADRVYTDRDSGKKIIAGVLRKIRYFVSDVAAGGDSAGDTKSEVDVEKTKSKLALGGVSSTGPTPFIYLSLTEIYGTQDFLVRYVNIETDTAKFERTIQIASDSPIETIEKVFPLPELPVGDSSVYAVELIWQDETLGSFRIVFEKVANPQHGDKNDNI